MKSPGHPSGDIGGYLPASAMATGGYFGICCRDGKMKRVKKNRYRQKIGNYKPELTN
jgi:hypothetical protein